MITASLNENLLLYFFDELLFRIVSIPPNHDDKASFWCNWLTKLSVIPPGVATLDMISLKVSSLSSAISIFPLRVSKRRFWENFEDKLLFSNQF